MSKKKIGNFPFTTGIYKDMYRTKLWTMRQYAGFSSVKESNNRFLSLLDSGVSGLSVAFDLPTQIGYDSDHEMSYGEIGKSGVPISTIDDMKSLFNEINLEEVSISMTINATASILLAFYVALAEERGYELSNLKGTIQNDILKEYIARGTYIFPINPSLKLSSDIFEYCQSTLPKWNSISVSGYHIREAGSTAVQELAFTFANAITYVNTAKKNGVEIETLTKQMSFFFNSHRDFFEEVSKFRAAREIWAKIVKERFKIEDSESQLCRFHVQTGGSTLTAQQIENNTVRTTLQALAAVLGGAQSIHTNSKDEAISLPSEENALAALRIQQIIAHETNIPNFVDPIGDSDLINSRTKEIVKEVSLHIPQNKLGIHCHNDTENAVANTLAAVRSGVKQVQGTFNGLGERCGNANLTTIIPTLILKMGLETSISKKKLKDLTKISKFIDERLLRKNNPSLPYVGESAFAHKGGIHASGIQKHVKTYEHIEPEIVGNKRNIVNHNK